ncbi:MAG: hypothetical protein LWX56_05050, partial [Ignavibacteria bacterium]|nr:hypothetical protein [Ignavibacteria bacterium]
YLCFCKSSPGPNEEVGKQVDSFTTAINSVRGKAMERLIDYGLWYAAKNKDKNADVPEPDRFDSEIKYKELLEHKLDKRNEKSPAVHSIFGIYLPNLMYLNKRWVIENISKIFPDNQPMYWEAAWASYITGSKFYTDVFKLLHPQYELAVKRLENGTLIKERGISRRTEEALAEHLVIACINGLENINEDTCLLRKFALVKKNNAAYHAVQYIWHLLLDSTIFADNPEGRPSFWPQAKIYWDLRIQTAKSYITDSDKNNVPEATSEFSLFLTWLKYIPSEVTLDELANLLTETLILNKEGYHLPELIDYLQQKSGEEPELAVRILKQAVETEAQIYFYQGKERIMEEILRKGLSTGNKTVLAEADIVMNTLGEKGNYYFKDLWLEYFINAN